MITAAFVLIAQEPQKSQIKFSHEFHIKLGDLGPVLKAARKNGSHLRPGAAEPGSGCQACHSGIEKDKPTTGLELMANCLVCHTRTDPPFSCPLCHTQEAAALKPKSHTNDFLDKHTAGLEKMNLVKSECAVCHGRKFTCLGCH